VANDWKGNTLNVADGALSSTSMRYHELAVQRWLNKVFTLRWGVPVPVVITSPMDAFSLFSKLWSEANNPFQYLLALKDENNVPLYQPYPQPVRYPLISVYRKGWKYRQYQNFSIHRMRHINWPTVSDAAQLHNAGTHQQGTQLTLCDLGHVTTSRFPMAFDYRFQVDHFCNRPDTQAFFTSQLFREFWRTGGQTLQTWSVVKYPGFGDKLVRIYIEGDIENLTPEEPEDGKNVEYRTSFTVLVEGYDLDLDYKIYPALWKLLLRVGTASPTEVNAAFDFTGTHDLREQPENPEVAYRQTVTVMPPPGTCAPVIRDNRLTQVDQIVLNSLVVTYPGPLAPPGLPPAAGVQAFGMGTLITGTNAFDDGGTHFDNGTNSVAFKAGSMDLYIYFEFAGNAPAFFSGTDVAVTVDSGTQYENGTNAITFFSGSHTDAVVFVDTGTESGTNTVAFGTGTYTDVIVDGGSYYESGSTYVTFTTGTYGLQVIDAGTYADSGSNSIGFVSGTYA
jgi:hypothetical protein